MTRILGGLLLGICALMTASCAGFKHLEYLMPDQFYLMPDSGADFPPDRGMAMTMAHFEAQSQLTDYYIAAALQAGMTLDEINAVLDEIAAQTTIAEFELYDIPSIAENRAAGVPFRTAGIAYDSWVWNDFRNTARHNRAPGRPYRSRHWERMQREMDDTRAQHMVAEATLTAHYIAAALQADMAPDEINAALTRIANQTVITEFWISDGDGQIVFTNMPGLDFAFPTDPEADTQAAPFAALLLGQESVIVQDVQPREFDGRLFQYVGVAGIDQPRIVQVGMQYEAGPHAAQRRSHGAWDSEAWEWGTHEHSP